MNLNKSQIGKIAAAKKAVELIAPGMIVGLGTGSTASYFIEALGLALKQGLNISAAATSFSSYQQALSLGIPMLDIEQIQKFDLTVDGADEIDLQKQMIKGGGGALLREKIAAYMSVEMIVIIDETKLVDHLGRFALPVEIAVFAHLATLSHLERLGAAVLRKNQDGTPFITDNGNFIADLKFAKAIMDPQSLNATLKNIPGVLETGLFINMAGRVIVGYEDGHTHIF